MRVQEHESREIHRNALTAMLWVSMIAAGCGLDTASGPDDDGTHVSTSESAIIPPPGNTVLIDFEGLTAGVTASSQYTASLGVTFTGGFKVCPRSFFGFLAPPASDKFLCGYAAAAGTIYEPAGGAAAKLTASFVYPVSQATIEFRTGIPTAPDSDAIVLTARDALGTIVAQKPCYVSNIGLTTEGVGNCTVAAPNIRTLEVEDGDADSLDNLVFVRQCEPLTISFDTSPAGTLGNLTLVDEQYAAWGVHFNNSFYVARRTGAFASYSQPPLTLNMICTFAGASGNPNCLAPLPPVAGGKPANAKLIATFDFPIYGAQVEGRTGVGSYDADAMTMAAWSGGNGTGTQLSMVTGNANNNPAPYSVEGVMRPSIHLGTPSIHSLVIDDGDADALDSLVLYTCQ